jgi:HPt (histidine-containing phosphotransfer) domain-containing protein
LASKITRARDAIAFATWLPERFLAEMGPTANVEAMKQYLIRIEQLVREGKSEREIEAVVKQLVDEDVQALDEKLDDELRPAA